MCTWTSTYFGPRLGIRFRMVGSQIFVPTSVSNGLGPKPSTERHLPWVEWHWFIGAAVVSRCESSKRKGGETREKVISNFQEKSWKIKIWRWKLIPKVYRMETEMQGLWGSFGDCCYASSFNHLEGDRTAAYSTADTEAVWLLSIQVLFVDYRPRASLPTKTHICHIYE